MGAAVADPLSHWLADLGRVPDVFFQAPERIWFGLPLLFVLLLVPLVRRSGRPFLPLVVRALILGALLGVLLEPAVEEEETRRGRLVVLADVSPSVGDAGLSAQRAYLEQARAPFDLILFGASPALVEEQTRDVRLDADARQATDVAAALRFGAVHGGAFSPLRVVLLSDGRATVPGAEQAALGLRREGVELLAVAVPEKRRPETPRVRAVRIDAPPRSRRREAFALQAIVRADADTRVTASLYLDGAAHRVREVALTAGENEVSFDELSLAPGRYYAQVLLASDATPHDNVAGLSLDVPGIPRVLCLAKEKRRSLIAEALRTQGLSVEVAAASEPKPLASYDAVVLLPDAPAADLENRAAELSEFVGRRGGGLVAVGGTEHGGLARFHGTPVSFLLPLEVQPRPRPEPAPPKPEPTEKPRVEIVEEKKEAYPITLCLVIDRSGSMMGYKLGQAKRAAIAAARALTREDRLAVIAFGDQAQLVLPPRSAGDADAIVSAVAGVRAEGGTALFAALQLGNAVLQREDSPIRHLVLLSDGKPSDRGRWRDLVTQMAKDKITVSTVGIGMDVDSHRMGKLASWGRGRYWLARPHEIPQVVTQDTLRVVKARDRRGEDAERAPPEPEKPEPEKEPAPETTPPDVPPPPAALPIVAEPGAPREMLKGLDDEELPAVAQVEEGKPRFASWIAARAGTDGPPLLAYWRVGLGTAAALMVDPEASASRELREHDELPRLIAQLVRSVLPDAAAEPFVVQQGVSAEGSEETLWLRVLAEDGLPRTDLPVELRVAGEPVALRRRADRYEAALPDRPTEVRAALRLGPADAPALARAFLLPPSASRELAETGPDRAQLLRLVGDRRRLDLPPAQALRVPEATFLRVRPLWLPFLLLAAILLPLDAWVRRRARSRSR